MILAHEVAGSGPALLLVHAGIADRRMWDDQVGPFAGAGWTVIRADLPGFHETPRPETRVALWATLRDLLDHLGVERAVVAGASLGGRAAVDLTLAAPERVRALVLVGSGLAGHRFAEPALFELWDRSEGALERGDHEEAAGPRSTPGWWAWTAVPTPSTPRSGGGSGRCCWPPTPTARPTWRSPTPRRPRGSARSPSPPWWWSASTTGLTSTPWPPPSPAASPVPSR